MHNTVIIPGSFDPCTNGHIDIIRRSARIFERVVVAVLTNSSKTPAFTIDERLDLLRQVTGDIPNVEIDSFCGLLVDYAKHKGAGLIVKGLRAVSDFEYEFQMTLANSKLSAELETIFMPSSANHMYLSSGLVREIARHGGNISDMVPVAIEKDILSKLSNC